MSTKIVTDSTAYIPKALLDEYNIQVISLNVTMNDKSYREIDLSNETFYTEMDKLEDIPTSSQPSPVEICNVFESIIKEGDSIVGIFLSSKMSGTYSSTNLAASMVRDNYPNADIHLIDSLTNCMQMGFMAIEAAKAAKEGKSVDEVISAANAVKSNSRFLFTPHTLEYLHKGGRIGGASAILGSILQIKPILTVENGETTVFTKVRTKKKAIDTILNKFLSDLEGKELGGIIVHHINSPVEGEQLASTIESKTGIKPYIGSIGPVIGLHVGPKSIGIAYYTK
ncbi:MAG: DegV family protein [Clostridium sp.]